MLQFAYGASLYGAERWVLALAKHLDPAKIETIVAGLRDGDPAGLPLVREAERLGFKTLVIEGRRNRPVSWIAGLRAALRRCAVDVVHSHGVRQDLVTLLATRGLGCRTLSTPHGWEGGGSPKARLYELLDKSLFPWFDAVAPLSHGLARSIGHVPMTPGQLRLIPNGVDLAEVEGAAPLAGLLPGQRSEADRVVGYVGQLIPRKGVDVLLRALARLEPAGWVCLVVGDGPCRGELERLARGLGIDDRVCFLGFRSDRLGLLKRFDLCVLPSACEGTPRAIMEALAAGVPCVGSRIPGITELLEDGVTGTTVPPNDPARLAAAIRLHLLDPAPAADLAEAGRARVSERFSAAAMASAYEALYAELVDGR